MNSANTNITLPSIRSLLNSIDGAAIPAVSQVSTVSAASTISAAAEPARSAGELGGTAGVKTELPTPGALSNYTSARAPVQVLNPVQTAPVPTPTPAPATPAALSSTAPMKKSFERRQSRSNLPKETIQVLNSWLLNHLNNPYPTAQEKRELLIKTGLTKIQLSNWFINVRRRKIFSDYYNLAKRSEEGGRERGQEREREHANASPYHREAGREPASAEIPLTRRKKLIDRLRELKKLANEET
ncbi:Cup9 protein [Maudiozyma humilis]|uniref:Cup9 protein n=1 Tax=Maudiozyma humilis TaxID=51915 RepID=A0AAV5S1K4_MAUHU|nr:Cup9 protein [Kazachstania humilis]